MIERERLLSAAPDASGGGLGFLSRWSRRKLGKEPVAIEPEVSDTRPLVSEVQADAEPVDVVEPALDLDPIDPRTGKRYSELTDDDMPAIESLDQNSDLSVFMARNVSGVLRMKALTRVFHTAKFNQICICAEYAEDYTNFTPLGDIVPHDLKQAIAREAGKLYERLTGKGFKVTPDVVEEHVAASMRGEAVPDLETILPREERAQADAADVTNDESAANQDEAEVAPELRAIPEYSAVQPMAVPATHRETT